MVRPNANQTKSGIIDSFVDCIAKDTEPSVPGYGVLPAMKAVFAAIESSKTGKTITV